MIDCVLDASAVLALLFEESGAETVEKRLPNAGVSAANHSEVVSKLADRGASRQEIDTLLAGVAAQIIPVDASLAMTAGMLRPSTRLQGLSLGDRMCLATACNLEVPALTTDRVWCDLDIGVTVETIR